MFNISCFYNLLIIKELQKSSISQRGVVLGHHQAKSFYRREMLKTTIFTLSIITISIFICSTLLADVIDDLIPLVIQAESSGNPTASDGHSYGLMGISQCVLDDFNKDAAGEPEINAFSERYKIYRGGKWRGSLYYQDEKLAEFPLQKKDLFNPRINKYVGVYYLRKIQSWLPEEYKNSKPHIIAAYNCGIGWLKKNNWKPPKSSRNKIYNKIYKGEL